MANRRAWSALSESYRGRLSRSGITESDYASGASIKAARGHATTPERPKQAFRNPDQYPTYIRRRVAKGKPVPENIIPKPSNRGIGHTPSIDDSIGWPGRDTVEMITFHRSPNGAKNGDGGFMTVTAYNPDGTVASVRQFPYNQSDFYTLIALARSRGYAAKVESLGSADMQAIIG
jgi:hypothetical protein